MRFSMVSLTHRFRAAFEAIRGHASSEYYIVEKFGNFPENCCDYSSLFICKYLYEYQLCRQPMIVKGHLIGDSYALHEWVIANGFTIDVTGDQFDSGPKVICKKSSRWHFFNFVIKDKTGFNQCFLDEYDEDVSDAVLDFYTHFKQAVIQI